jgi:GNAT superfamily N-acetyltransferase
VIAFTAPRPLKIGDEVVGFDCGVEAINDWVAKYAQHAHQHGTAVVYASFSDTLLAGVYSLSSHSVTRDEISKGWFRRNTPKQIPAILVGILAVDVRFQHQELGEQLLRDAVDRAQSVARQIGAKALIVDPIDKSIVQFYKKYGFEDFADNKRLLFRLR